VAIIQARIGSSRLPGKVLLPLAGVPLLERVVQRVSAARRLDEVVVATTSSRADDPVRELCRRIDVPCFSGHPTDLLDRHLRAARQYRADLVVKVPSDCPLIDPRIIDRVLDTWATAGERLDYLGNLHPATYPDGNDVEVIPLPILEQAFHEATQPHEREHTTPFIWGRPERFRIGNVVWESGRDLSTSHRFSIDYLDDYRFISAIYEALHVPGLYPFCLGDILRFLEEHPEVFALNSHLAGVSWYRLQLEQLRPVAPQTGGRDA
jgi:spore coat polysaccharide biosynthesis protein SpsF